MAKSSQHEAALVLQIRCAKLPDPVREYRLFAELVGKGKGVRYRLEKAGFQDFYFDFAWPDAKYCAEIQGKIWHKGGHTSGKGMIRDCKKEGDALMLGWCVSHFVPEQITSGYALNVIEQVLFIR